MAVVKGKGILSQPPQAGQAMGQAVGQAAQQAYTRPMPYQGNQNFFPNPNPQIPQAYQGQQPQQPQGQMQRVSPGVYRDASGNLVKSKDGMPRNIQPQQRPMMPAQPGQPGQFQRPMPMQPPMQQPQFQQMPGQFQRPMQEQFQPQFGQQQAFNQYAPQNFNYQPMRYPGGGR